MSINSSTVDLLGKSLSLYVLAAVAGVFAGVLVAELIRKERGLSFNFIFRMMLGVLLIGFLAQTFVSNIPNFMLTYSYLLGLFAATGLFLLIGKLFGKNPRDCAEIGLIATNTFMIFSKTGCFFAGCCHSLPYGGALSVVYGSETHCLLAGTPIFPIQLAEVAVRILVLGFMLLCYYKRYLEKYKIPLYICLMGECYFWGMLFWYGPMRTVNQGGINFILLFNILFGLGSVIFLVLSVISDIQEKKNKMKYIGE